MILAQGPCIRSTPYVIYIRKVFGTGFYWVRGYFNYGALNCSCTSDETWSYCVLCIIHVYTLYDTKFYMFTFQCGIMSLYIKRFSYIFIVWEEDVYWLWACCRWMRRISCMTDLSVEGRELLAFVTLSQYSIFIISWPLGFIQRQAK